MNNCTDIVFYSGGIASYVTAKRVAERCGTENLILLFTDTKIEDCDLYRFLEESARDVGGELIKIAEGRTPWEVFKDEGFIGHRAPCSRILKRKPARDWVLHHYPDPSQVRLWIGMNWDEEHRLQGAQKRWHPYQVGSTLTERPLLCKDDMLAVARANGLEPPRQYTRLGQQHANCGGGCVKAGIGHFLNLMRAAPDVYAEWERNEEGVRKHIGKDVSILRDRRGGKSTPLTLRTLREREQEGEDWLFEEAHDLGGCGCFTDGHLERRAEA